MHIADSGVKTAVRFYLLEKGEGSLEIKQRTFII